MSFHLCWGKVDWDALPTQHVAIWRPGNEIQQSAVFVVRLGTAGTNPADCTSKLRACTLLLLLE